MWSETIGENGSRRAVADGNHNAALQSHASEHMGEAFDDGIAARRVDCPHMENGDLERIANHAIDSTALNWRKKLNEELVELITPRMG